MPLLTRVYSAQAPGRTNQSFRLGSKEVRLDRLGGICLERSLVVLAMRHATSSPYFKILPIVLLCVDLRTQSLQQRGEAKR